MKKLIIISLVVAVLGTVAIVFGTMAYVQSLTVHPDKVVTVFNPTTNARTQSYLIGDLQVFIEQTYRMDMKTFMQYVNMHGLAHRGDKYVPIPDGGAEELSMLAKNPDANPNPFVLKLRVRNVGPYDHEIRSRQVMIRRDNTIMTPHEAWQKKMAEAGIFSGVEGDENSILKAGEVETLWLVYATSTEENPFREEFVRMLYGSDQDWLAVKVEFPFNFVYGTPIGDYKEITDNGYQYGAVALLLFYAVLGIVSWRISRNIG